MKFECERCKIATSYIRRDTGARLCIRCAEVRGVPVSMLILDVPSPATGPARKEAKR
jgi:hypothetical protein